MPILTACRGGGGEAGVGRVTYVFSRGGGGLKDNFRDFSKSVFQVENVLRYNS